MASRIKSINLILGVMLSIGIAGSGYEAYQVWEITNVNNQLLGGKVITDDSYPFQEKFSAGYFQGKNQDFKHAIQTYSQMIEAQSKAKSLSPEQQAIVQYNIGNNLFLSGLTRRLNDDGSIKEEAKYSFIQAKIAYEQALRMDSTSPKAKFNLSLLNVVIPLANKSTMKDQSGVELSNLPVGLP